MRTVAVRRDRLATPRHATLPAIPIHVHPIRVANLPQVELVGLHRSGCQQAVMPSAWPRTKQLFDRTQKASTSAAHSLSFEGVPKHALKTGALLAGAAW